MTFTSKVLMSRKFKAMISILSLSLVNLLRMSCIRS